ncbi:hypothetical protein A8E63_13815 [Burkholderia cenocepacia]|uniref:DUF4116 domain-containing protein n=2 Tax=Burkholderia cenocepacia TaxID=95486 RepID=A0A1V2VTT4_9BURK|nr:hypothetical protein A8E72_33850 [Burkholderia cenocepacia]ONU88996.1 hypothetical protein A8E63_13815 [Burkholderia cenocepacia]
MMEDLFENTFSSYEITPNPIVWRDEFNKYLEKWGEEVYESIALIYNFDRIDTKLLESKEFLIDSIKVNPQLYDFLCEEKQLQNNKDLKHAYWHSMVSIVGAHYGNINDKELYDNKNLALVAIEGYAIAQVVKHCSERLLDDEQVMYASALQNPEALSKASMRLREDPEFMLKICKECSNAIEFLGPQLLTDVGENDPVEYLTKRVQNDKLAKQLSEKPITKAQRLSDELEDEDFTYKPAIAKTNRTKL